MAISCATRRNFWTTNIAESVVKTSSVGGGCVMRRCAQVTCQSRSRPHTSLCCLKKRIRTVWTLRTKPAVLSPICQLFQSSWSESFCSDYWNISNAMIMLPSVQSAYRKCQSLDGVRDGKSVLGHSDCTRLTGPVSGV